MQLYLEPTVFQEVANGDEKYIFVHLSNSIKKQFAEWDGNTVEFIDSDSGRTCQVLCVTIAFNLGEVQGVEAEP